MMSRSVDLPTNTLCVARVVSVRRPADLRLPLLYLDSLVLLFLLDGVWATILLSFINVGLGLDD
jgi:hypothetical protein